MTMRYINSCFTYLLTLSTTLDYLSICCTPHIRLTTLISARAKASSFSLVASQQ